MFGLNDADDLLSNCFNCLGPDMIGGHDSTRSKISQGKSLSRSRIADIEPIENDANDDDWTDLIL
jgi:hypothetical protein